MANYYELLDVAESASILEIKKAYRIKAKQYHPDLNSEQGSSEKFIAIEEAYSCLSDHNSKRAYDQLLKYDREQISRPTVQRKYQNDVNKRTSKGRKNASRHTQMSYNQYQRDEFLRSSSMAIFIQSIFTIVTGILLGFLLHFIAVKIYGPYNNKWVHIGGIRLLGMTYMLSLIGLTYLYEPFVKYLLVGKPKRN